MRDERSYAREGTFEHEIQKRCSIYGRNAHKAREQVVKEVEQEYKDKIRRELEQRDGKMHNV